MLEIDSKMPFGKYEGVYIKIMLNFEHFTEGVTYLEWAIKTWNNVKFSEEIKKLVKQKIENENKYISKLQSKYEFEFSKERQSSRGDHGAFSCPGDYLGMGPSDFGIPHC